MMRFTPSRQFVLWRKKSFGTQSYRGNLFAERVMTVAHLAHKQERARVSHRLLRGPARGHCGSFAIRAGERLKATATTWRPSESTESGFAARRCAPDQYS